MHPTTEASPSALHADGTANAVTIRFWGTRGSIPSPGPQTTRYGANTTSFEVRHGEQRLIFDAGSGLRALGLDLVENGGEFHHIFLTHFHWDHIQGFPFFAPLYNPDIDLKIVGPRQNSIDVRSLFAGQMGPIYFPVPFSVVAATMSFEHLNEGSLDVAGATLHTMRMKHPSYVIGYRIEVGGKVICFIPDNELEGDMYDVDEDAAGILVEIAGRAFTGPDGNEQTYITPEELHFLSIKRGTLDEAERKEIESHVMHSFDFPVNIPWTEELCRIAEIVRGHHEKLNGKGYPDGVTREELSIETRIMSVCDIFDALTASDRPYKKSMPVEKALQILQWEAEEGALEPDIVELFTSSEVYRKVMDRDWREF